MRSLRHSTASTRTNPSSLALLGAGADERGRTLCHPEGAQRPKDLLLIGYQQILRFAQDDNCQRLSAFRPCVSVLTLLVLTVLISATLRAQDGKVVYDPHPRDFTKAVYKIRTTASGEIPTDDDLRHVIEVGMPGTAMPEWKSRLSGAEITAVIQYLKSFSPNSFKGTAAKAIAIGKAPSGSGVDEGKAVFQKLECYKCHGAAGRADGKSAPTLKDDYGNPIRPADLTENWKFRGGSSVSDI